jgi:hypothetical protein
MFRRTLLAALLCAACITTAHADRRYFVDTYTPYLAPAGTLELEAWSSAAYGQGDSVNTAWVNRLEFEHAFTDRVTGAFYLNFEQAPGGASVFDGPSLEVIAQLADPGKLPLDPAVYLEVRDNGDELELEPKLLLGKRMGTLVAAANVIGEFEYMHTGSGEVEKVLGLTAGLSKEFGAKLSVGVEADCRKELVDGGDDPEALFVGPTLNFQTTKVQLALGWHPQVWGSGSGGSLNTSSFERSQVRLILGIGL